MATRTEAGAVADVPADPLDARRRDGAWTRDHAVNVRISVPSPFGRFYLVVVGGRERRSAERRSQERGKHPLATAGNLLFFLSCGIAVGLATLGLIQLLARSVLEQAGLANF